MTTDRNIFNYSSYVLSDCEKLVLSRGFGFCILPPHGINSPHVFAEFEILFLHSPVSLSNVTYLKACLGGVAHHFVNTPVDSGRCLWQESHFKLAKRLKCNTDILLTRPDKGTGVVILNWVDYIDKMNVILDDTDKFLKPGDLFFDDTHKLEMKLQKCFLELFRKKIYIEGGLQIYSFCRITEAQNVWSA